MSEPVHPSGDVRNPTMRPAARRRSSGGGRRNATALVLFAVVAGMTGLAFASVPLYRLFCQVTGYGGTPRTEAVALPATAVSEQITVQFDANVNPALPWRFAPGQRQVRVRLGEQNLAYYEAVNDSDRPVTGTAVFNVSPYKAALYFNKIDCFCFNEQTLTPGQQVSMPVSFYVDPAILDDPNTRDVSVITLSYTFYPVEDDGGDEPAAASEAAALPAASSGG